ncbi:MAG: class I tRNA ligase family protein, partial [Chloroflexia bacterium]|nr:class I tRNA ligase family protein [Chloroflexia bacterium]
MTKAYDPTSVEGRWYDWWDSQGYFEPRGEGEPYTIIMPPPNVTGELHMGHALFVTVEDVLLRWRRMQG